MSNNKKRILWLISQSTLRNSEVKLLINLGYEVYTPKILPQPFSGLPESKENLYDGSLTIPVSDLDKLNGHDFYLKPLEEEILSLVNDYFDVVICDFFSYLVIQVIKNFKNKIVLRALGLPTGKTYTQLLNEIRPGLIHDIALNQHRIWFAQAYQDFSKEESPLLKRLAVSLPHCLPTNFLVKQNSWKGTINKLLFYYPLINNAFLGELDAGFRRELQHFPHVIATLQPLDVKSAGELDPQAELELSDLLNDLKVMFYPVENPAYIDFYPIRAMFVGMPVLFLKNCFLERILGEDHPGVCASYSEVRKKIFRIFNNDKAFIRKIKNNQQKLIEYFSSANNLETWKNNFAQKIMAQANSHAVRSQSKLTKKIAVFLPQPFHGSIFEGAKQLANLLAIGSREFGDCVQVVFSYPEDAFNPKESFHDLLQNNIHLRETKWHTVSHEKVAISLNFLEKEINSVASEYSHPEDGICNFADCDFWFVITDRLLHPIAPVKPYALVLYDCLYRYVPDIIEPLLEDVATSALVASSFVSVNNAEFLISTTPTINTDLITYAGVSPSKIHTLTTSFTNNEKKKLEDYYVWPADLKINKNDYVAEMINKYHEYNQIPAAVQEKNEKKTAANFWQLVRARLW